MMLIDLNEERSLEVEPSGDDNDAFVSHKDSYDSVYLGENQKKRGGNLGAIYIGTLARYKGHGSGDYKLTSIKQMTGTRNFLAWPLDKRLCSLEKYENCQMRAFEEETKKCGCTPFQLLPARRSDTKVHTMQKLYFKLVTQNFRFAHLLA